MNKSSIVLVGAWNARIFTPQWIASNGIVAEGEDVTVEITFGVAPYHSRLKFNRVILQLSDDKLAFIPSEDSEQAFESCRSVAAKIVELLPHTPLAAMGINRHYIWEGGQISGNGVLGDIFNFNDDPLLGQNNWVVGSRAVKRVVEKAGLRANFAIELSEEGEVSFGFNFHYLEGNVTRIKEILEQKQSKEFTDAAKEIIRDVYGVDPDDE
ncbi:MAG: hypothetical protein ACK4SX_08395 [Alcanivoracaceae bacterium]